MAPEHTGSVWGHMVNVARMRAHPNHFTVFKNKQLADTSGPKSTVRFYFTYVLYGLTLSLKLTGNTRTRACLSGPFL